MANKDTICLLKECDAGTKMAVSSIDEVLEKLEDEEMRQLLTESREHHEKLGNELHSMLLDQNSAEKDPNIMAKGMSWMKTNMKMSMDENPTAAAADLLTDGCHMGIKSLHKYLNQYSAADSSAKDICKRLVNIEEALCRDLQPYL